MATRNPAEPLGQAERIGGPRAWLNALDLSLYRLVRGLATDPEQVKKVRAFSTLGEYGAVWFGIGVAGLALDRDRSHRWRRAIFTVAVAHGVSSTVKVVVNRRRPAVEDLEHLMATPTGLSFPSTHTATSFAAARVYSGLIPGTPLYAMALVMATSRLYLGVHYPSDVAAGAAVGVLVGSVGR